MLNETWWRMTWKSLFVKTENTIDLWFAHLLIKNFEALDLRNIFS